MSIYHPIGAIVVIWDVASFLTDCKSSPMILFIIVVPLLPCDCTAFMENLGAPCLTAWAALNQNSCTINIQWLVTLTVTCPS
jgi:hypothetical protein